MAAALGSHVAAAETTLVQRHFTSGGATLRSIAVGRTRIVAVGDGGTILSSRDGQNWTRHDAHGTESLLSVAYSAHSGPASLFVAVGEAGKLLISSDAETWSPVALPGVTARLNHVSTLNGRFFIVGDGGTLIHSLPQHEYGRHWAVKPSGTTASLVAITGVNSSDVIALGAEGTAVLGRFDGDDWRPLELGHRLTLATMVGTYAAGSPFNSRIETLSVGANGAYVVGQNVTGSGREFSLHSTGTSAALHGIAIGRTSIVVVGERGTILKADDTDPASPAWRALNSNTTATLTAVAFRWRNESSSFFVVGEHEQILQIDDRHHARLHNLAIRARGGSGAEVLTSGFVIDGTEPKPVLVRAAGPALAAFGLDDTMREPALTIFDRFGRPVANTTAGWGSSSNLAELRAAAQSVGAFAFPERSADAALLLSLTPGAYTAQVSDRAGGVGLALIELYDLQKDPGDRPRLINLSARCFIGNGDAIAIPGITALGNRMPRLLIRAVGPGLAQFGVTGTLADPKIEIVQPETYTNLIGGGVLMPARIAVANDDWSAQSSLPQGVDPPFQRGTVEDIRTATIAAGAFPLEEGSRDAVLLLTFAPSRYSIQIRGADGGSGVALIEIYDVSEH